MKGPYENDLANNGIYGRALMGGKIKNTIHEMETNLMVSSAIGMEI